MAKNKRDVEGIDEAALLQSIYEQDNDHSVTVQPKVKDQPATEQPAEPVPEQPVQEQPEKPKEAKRRRNQADYSSIFLQRNELKERSCVYISKRIHSTISEIVRVIANRDVTVGGYIDSVLLQHLEAHRDEINELYRQDRKDLIP